MASVFLSYDHQDADQARVVARSLEKAGHEVWWDRHIRGGAQYAQEIEQAIERSDAVVVLWSAASAASEWVRDEAAAGRDRRRLVPVRIEPVDPPMGFRQFQTIDLSGRRGAKRAAGLRDLERAVAAMAGIEAASPTEPARRTGLSRRSMAALIWVVALALFAAGLWVWQPWRQRTSTPLVTVEASDPSAASRAMANNLLVQLGSLQASRADLPQLADPDTEVDPDLIVKVAAHPAQHGAQSASVALIRANRSSLLWSKEFGGDNMSLPDLRQQLAYTTAKVLECAAEASSTGGKSLDAATFKLFLNGCADLSTMSVDESPRLIESFRKITSAAPTFAPGWGGLLALRTDALAVGGLNDPKLRQELREAIDSARKFHPELVETFLAEAWLQPPRPIAGWIGMSEKAVTVDPNHPRALLNRANALRYVGRINEALNDSRKAAQVDPLSQNTRSSLVYALLEAGQTEAARNELAEIEQLWRGSRAFNGIRFQVEFRYGDPGRALAMARSGEIPTDVSPIRLASLEAKVAGTPQAIDRAIEYARQSFFKAPQQSLGPYLQALAEFNRHEQAMQVMLTVDPAASYAAPAYMFRPAFDKIYHDPRFMRVAERFGLIDYWRETGKWPDFCSRPDLPYDCEAEAARISGTSR